jgi:hypothetical protein
MHVMTGLYDGAASETATINPAALFPDDEPPAPKKKAPARRAKPS